VFVTDSTIISLRRSCLKRSTGFINSNVILKMSCFNLIRMLFLLRERFYEHVEK